MIILQSVLPRTVKSTVLQSKSVEDFPVYFIITFSNIPDNLAAFSSFSNEPFDGTSCLTIISVGLTLSARGHGSVPERLNVYPIHTSSAAAAVPLFVVNCTKTTVTIVGFEVLTAVSMKMAVFWVVAPCSLACEAYSSP
jgi:hypothetical protein